MSIKIEGNVTAKLQEVLCAYPKEPEAAWTKREVAILYVFKNEILAALNRFYAHIPEEKANAMIAQAFGKFLAKVEQGE